MNKPDCINRQVWDEQICKCVCPRFKCPVGIWNEKLCNCVGKDIEWMNANSTAVDVEKP
jgi:hypothetical protein